MEVRGHILAPGTYSPAGGSAGRLQELRERQRGLRQALGLRLRELRRLCLQEAELTGQLPPEYPLEPGERPQPPPPAPLGRAPPGTPPRVAPRTPPVAPVPPCVTWGPPPSCRSPHALVCRARREAQAQVQVQAQVLEAARRLAAVPGLAPEQRRRRQRLQAEAAQRLRQLRAQLGAPGHDENGSLCELPALENGALPPPQAPPGWARPPLPPRAGSSSPERRPLPPWTPEVPPGRRSSLASPASPARTLPRSASSLEGRSVPATPVLARSARGAALPRPEAPGLPPRPWSGSQDSQLGGPPPQNPPPAGAPRTRRSNSSEALIDWGGGALPETPPESSRVRGGGPGGSGVPCAPPSLEQRRSQKWLALEGLRDWYLRHTGTPPAPRIGGVPPNPGNAWVPPQRRRDPPGAPHPAPHAPPHPAGLPHSLSYAGALAPRSSGDTPGATPPTPPGPATPRDPRVTPPPTPTLAMGGSPNSLGGGGGSPKSWPPLGRSWRAAAFGGDGGPIARPLLGAGGVWGGRTGGGSIQGPAATRRARPISSRGRRAGLAAIGRP
ncbi:LOW QUALITY PROTEIN: coiled-coil domain-containing protein 120 [Chamaea fasciata]|uniref:LOW QUALITY PROTEIN: coiled-coil domain-containing protein 120 n=1 Tax=Chamaea fasciata TaxID=190680 RepID=UPI00336AA4F1